MKELREQLNAAKAEYRSVRYPGDLAAETLRHAHRPRRWMWLGGLATAAAAAMVALIVWMRPASVPAVPEIAAGPATGQMENEQFSLGQIERPSTPSRPISPGAFPARRGIGRPSLPGVPSWDALMREQQSSSNLQESV